MLRVAIATSSQEKIEGIQEAFLRFFQLKKSEIEISFRKTESKVPEQPFDSEIYVGAYNRVEKIKEELEGWDYYVSCEAGIEGFVDNYFNVQVVCILEAASKNYLWGKSAGWQVPSKDIKAIKNGTLDSYLREKGFRCLEDILGLSHTRSQAVAQATEMALASKKLV